MPSDLKLVTTPHYLGWIWVIFRDGLPARDSLEQTGDQWETEAEARAAGMVEMGRLEQMKKGR